MTSLKLSSSSGIRSGLCISVYNFTTRYHAYFGNQSILNFRALEVRDTRSHKATTMFVEKCVTYLIVFSLF